MEERRFMSNYIESELHRIIAVSERNEKISSDYAFKFFRIFLTAAEAKEILEIIQRSRDYHVVHSKAER
jgi:alpha-amylase/alpha-mannosidase (GH57 family)